MSASPLSDLRAELARQGLDGFIVPRADEHLGEYVPASAERLAWLTGFTGSAGLAAILPDRAAVFSDGRYTLQLEVQTDPALWERRHLLDEPPFTWLASHAGKGARIGYDPLLISEEGLQRYSDAGLTMVAVTRNPVDAVWTDRPAPPAAPAVPHPLGHAGRDSAEKRAGIAETLRSAQQDAAILTDPAAIAWLLNIRGADVPYTPFALGFAILHADAGCELFMDPRKLPEATRAHLGNAVSVADRAALPAALGRLAGRRVRVDPATAPVWFAQTLRASGAEVIPGMDPCLLPKACKNPTEQQGARDAHHRDAIAVCRFLHWLDTAAGRETEISAAERLLAFRAGNPAFRGESFPAISGAGEHGAIIHYRVTPATDRPIRPDEPYLIDSGAQYADGTTDITRTVWTGPGTPPAELRDRVTRVLKGHIALATLVFPQGVAGPHLDAFARSALWRAGLDYDHGTGHGVGSYLSVHEGPVSISRAAKPVAIAAGMILSNEPGFYAPGEYGIRLENLVLVQPAELPGAKKPFLRFETLTLAPFDRRLIDRDLLTAEEILWLDTYHAYVVATVGPHLDPAPRAWLQAACAALAG
ncbi:Xaa-Pro aminopeptidase [Rhodovastum atsumiense]|uniref:Aminopeptidase P family protein n=1 Tax=Rhodovastum atsumiense TaxID=504468 RepID=A0A5M6J1X7_9PROT|nr:aminopeptidase P family protein [Rhodovastum atsumiense]KAA5613598.1 aminopeptidase P family protein [Rhodovastum atsumiense]CAH2599499.1 Xaa-Pro aminopeptidase [Rhodovastum atsumiense]